LVSGGAAAGETPSALRGGSAISCASVAAAQPIATTKIAQRSVAPIVGAASCAAPGTRNGEVSVTIALIRMDLPIVIVTDRRDTI